MSVCIISFSSRKNGNCETISHAVHSLFPNGRQYHFSDFTIHPCGACDGECFEQEKPCPWFADKEKDLFDAIINSSVTYFIIPNYCDYPCANFFAFNERRLCCMKRSKEVWSAYEKAFKKAIVVSNTNQDNFKKILEYHFIPENQILFLSARKYGKSSLKGDLLTAESAMEDLRNFIEKNPCTEKNILEMQG